MLAPLLDSRGNLRYFIGAQVDVSGLVKECAELDAFKHYLDVKEQRKEDDPAKDEFQQLSEMFNHSELDIVRRYGGNMHREHVEEDDGMSMRGGQAARGGPRVLIKDLSDFEAAAAPSLRGDGRLQGVYKNVRSHSRICPWLLIRVLVPIDQARAFPPHPICVALPPRPRYPPVAVPGSHRRQHAHTQLGS